MLKKKKKKKKEKKEKLQAIEYQLHFNFNSGLGIKQKKYSIYLKNVVTKFSNYEDSIYLACEYHKVWLYKVK